MKSLHFDAEPVNNAGGLGGGDLGGGDAGDDDDPGGGDPGDDDPGGGDAGDDDSGAVWPGKHDSSHPANVCETANDPSLFGVISAKNGSLRFSYTPPPMWMVVAHALSIKLPFRGKRAFRRSS